VLYGTNINSNEVQQKLRNFLNSYVHIDENEERYDQEPYYIEQLRNIRETEQYILDVDCDHIFEFDQGLYRQLENYPTDIIPIFDLVVTGLFKEQILSEVENNNNNNNNNEDA
jgi:DNA replicative helicase MCM subunit Mcm2 (Cdc46/Mcm family)